MAPGRVSDRPPPGRATKESDLRVLIGERCPPRTARPPNELWERKRCPPRTVLLSPPPPPPPLTRTPLCANNTFALRIWRSRLDVCGIRFHAGPRARLLRTIWNALRARYRILFGDSFIPCVIALWIRRTRGAASYPRCGFPFDENSHYWKRRRCPPRTLLLFGHMCVRVNTQRSFGKTKTAAAQNKRGSQIFASPPPPPERVSQILEFHRASACRQRHPRNCWEFPRATVCQRFPGRSWRAAVCQGPCAQLSAKDPARNCPPRTPRTGVCQRPCAQLPAKDPTVCPEPRARPAAKDPHRSWDRLRASACQRLPRVSRQRGALGLQRNAGVSRIQREDFKKCYPPETNGKQNSCAHFGLPPENYKGARKTPDLGHVKRNSRL